MRILLKRPESKYWVEGKYRIYINDSKVNELKTGQTVDFDAPTQRVTILAKRNWCGSKKLGQMTIFECQRK
jgi:hypothetical protein